MAKKARAKKIAWGESSDVLLLPKDKAVRGGRVMRTERRLRGKMIELSARDSLINYNDMLLAKLLFPEHIIKMVALQTREKSLGKGQRPPRYFSKHYPLPKKIRAEALEIRKLIRQAHKGKAGDEFVRTKVKAFDRRARKTFPELIPTAKKLENAEIVVPHPELNFTVHRGKIMFYEAYLEFSGKPWAKVVNVVFSKARQMPRQKARKFLVQAIRMLCKRGTAGYWSNKEISTRLGKEIHQLLLSSFEAKILNFKEIERLMKPVDMLQFTPEKITDLEAHLKKIRLQKY